LNKKKKVNPPEEWVINKDVFPAIISHEQADKIFRHTQVKKKQKLREIIKG